MIVAVADTHTTLWYLFSDPRLGAAASSFLDQTSSDGDHVGISAISIAEIVYLIEKGRIAREVLPTLRDAIADPASVLQHVPVEQTIALMMREVPRIEVPDLPDRLIAATALFLGVPVLRRDARLQSSSVKTIW